MLYVWWRWHRYEAIVSETKEDSSSTRDIEENSCLLREGRLPENSGRSLLFTRSALLTVINLITLFTTITLNGLNLLPSSTAAKNDCIRSTSYFSPIIEQIPLEHHDVLLNGTLFPGTQPGVGRRVPGDPEGEAFWESLEAVKPLPITRDDVLALGKDPNTVSKFPDELFGLGDEAYIAALGIQHKLHCLNVLRKAAFSGYEEDAPQTVSHSQIYWIHLRHCVDMITQDMVCHADADLITYQWVDTLPYPAPDMSTNRRCRNINDLFKYRDEHKVDIDKYGEMKKPKSGINQIPCEPEYYAMYGFKNSDLYPDGHGYGPLPPNDWFGTPPS